MYSRSVIVTNKEGLHARPAANFVKRAGQFVSKITVTKDDRSADAKSIVGVLTLMANQNSEILIAAEGEDEKRAVDALVEMVKEKIG
ncbi:MAG: HPr family phosphocarrier protein [Clostridiales Family XIII bacterium]|jgi:phosphotransferase system HPr (HPr) family protein|nr:HPr family phosphocarrier protein [Clostridiales Family XIII bacterium]